jgi:hypothetical protein
MPKYIGYNFTGTANTTVVTSALNGGVTDRKYNSGIWSMIIILFMVEEEPEIGSLQQEVLLC